MSHSCPYKTISILGPGLLGGSVALASRFYLPHVRVKLWGRRPEPLAVAKAFDPEIEIYTDINSAVEGADLVILATPVGIMPRLCEQIFPVLSPSVCITDVGSVKGFVHDTVGRICSDQGVCFIGSHPMAGSENQGMEYADPQLFTGATCVISNNENQSTQQVEDLMQFWSALGGITLPLDAYEHDMMVARISHFPHALASLGVQTALQGRDIDALGKLAAGGFRDTTRVAMGEPHMWSEILLENKPAVLDCLARLQNEIGSLCQMLETNDKATLAAWLDQARAMRAQALDLNHSDD